MNKKILVVSHERSGTHFLINTINKNIPGMQPWKKDFPVASLAGGASVDKTHPSCAIPVDDYKMMLENYLLNVDNLPSDIVYKSHHHPSLLNLNLLLEKFHVFYIVRDCKDTLTSCYHYFQKCPPWFPKEKDVETFLFDMPPSNYGFHYDYYEKSYDNLVDRWSDHVTSWSKVSGIHIVRYEDLHNQFELEIKRIFDTLGLPIPKTATKPGLGDKSVQSRKGVVGDSKNLMSTLQMIRVDNMVSEY